MKVRIPAQTGEPLKMQGVTKDPFAGLDQAAGFESGVAEIRRIAEIASEMRRNAMAATLVVPGNVLDNNLREITLKLRCDLAHKVGRDGLMLVMGEDGNDLYQTTREFMDDFGLESLDGLDDQLLEQLDAIHRVSAPNDQAMLSSHLADLTLQKGTLLIDLFSRTGVDRIKAMKELADSQGALMVCCGLLPRSARELNAQTAVPYIALPPHPEFTGPVFAEKGDKVVATTDSLSRLSHGSMKNFIELIRKIEARRVVISQAVKMSDQTNFIPPALHFNPANLSVKAMGPVISAISLKFMAEHLEFFTVNDPYITTMVLEQAYRVVNQMFMEFAQMRMRQLANNSDYSEEVKTQREEAFLGTDEAREYFSTIDESGTLKDLFEQGVFNVHEAGPFGELTYKDPGIPEGILKCLSHRFDLIFDRKPKRKGPKGPAVKHAKSLSAIMPDQFGKLDITEALRRIYLTQKRRNEIPSNLTVDQFVLRGVENRSTFDQAVKLGTQLAFKWIFNSKLVEASSYMSEFQPFRSQLQSKYSVR